jgi:hypothetical protein
MKETIPIDADACRTLEISICANPHGNEEDALEQHASEAPCVHLGSGLETSAGSSPVSGTIRD